MNQYENTFFEKVTEPQFIKDFKKLFPIFSQFEIHEAYENIVLPRRATPKSAGYDFVLPMDISLFPNESMTIPTGIKASMEDFLSLDIYPRSGLGFKYFVRLANTVGIGDSDYYDNADNEGHYFVKIRNEGNIPLELCAGERFCQGIFRKYYITKDDEPLINIRTGGLGSSGK